MNNNLKGFAYGIATSVTFGLIPLFTLPLMEKGMRFDSILFYRFLFAAIALSGMLLAKKESFRTEMRNLPILILLGAFYTGSAMFLFWGYNFMSAGIATTLHFTYPIFVTLFMLFVFKEKTSWITLLAIGLAICGVARLSIDGGEMRLNGLGVIIVLLSAVAYALYIVTVNKSRVHDMPGRKLTFYVFIVSTSLFFIKAQAGTGIQPIPDLPSFINLVLLAFLPTVVSNITLVSRTPYRFHPNFRTGSNRTRDSRLRRCFSLWRAFHPSPRFRNLTDYRSGYIDYPVQIHTEKSP